MNIGIFTDTYYPEINGVASSTYELKKGLEQMGHSVYIFTVTHPSSNPHKEKNVYRITSIPFPMLRERRIGLTISKRWKRKIERLHLDIIHTQTEFIMGRLGRKMADYLDIPHIHTYHTIYEDYLSYLHMPDRKCFRKMTQQFSKICCNRADEIIVPTDKVRNLLRQYGVQREVHVIPSGISLQKFMTPDTRHVKQLRQQYSIKADQTVLLYIGRLSAEKNISELLTYLHGTPDKADLLFLIVGDGPERETLEQQVQQLHLETNVLFTGMVPFDQIEDYYALGDIFVSASTSETQGLTYIEALAAGMPLLVRQDNCLDGILQQSKNGIAYTCEEQFQQGLTDLRTGLQLSMSFTPCSIRKSVTNLGADEFARQVEALYQKDRLFTKPLDAKKGGQHEHKDRKRREATHAA